MAEQFESREDAGDEVGIVAFSNVLREILHFQIKWTSLFYIYSCVYSSLYEDIAKEMALFTY